MESIAAMKELLSALAAVLYLGWDYWRRLSQRERERVLSAQKDHLDRLLNETVRIEQARMVANGPEQLKAYLDDVTRIKLRALEELTGEDLRGDQFFAIFLAQCANRIRKIQSKMFLLLQSQPPLSPNSDRPAKPAPPEQPPCQPCLRG